MDGSTSSRPLEELVREHAALRRVAVLVAREPSPAEVFEAVAREVGTLLGARRSQLVRVASAEEGVVAAVWSDAAAMPVGAEDRVAEFAQLVAYAIENAEARNELAESRVRLVTAADEARRRIERDLHDGAQQRLVAAALELTILEKELGRDPGDARAALARAREQLDSGLGELRDLARGIHPSVLTDRGLEAALEALVKRAPVPVELRVDVQERGDDAIEAATYFLVSEALTNVAKHAHADAVSVEVEGGGETVAVTIADDGVGGADATAGSGLTGLADRVHAVGGRLEVSSTPGEGTRIHAILPTSVLGSLNGN